MYFYKRCIEYYQHLIINESLKRITKIEIMLEYQKCSTQTQVLITFTRIAQILYDLTRTRDAKAKREMYDNTRLSAEGDRRTIAH